jgi:hypothetical protein
MGLKKAKIRDKEDRKLPLSPRQDLYRSGSGSRTDSEGLANAQK